jgi:cell wall-associated NlpC family hydrolase
MSFKYLLYIAVAFVFACKNPADNKLYESITRDSSSHLVVRQAVLKEGANNSGQFVTTTYASLKLKRLPVAYTPGDVKKIHILKWDSLRTGAINTDGVSPNELISFARTLEGIPYLYGSTDPSEGFDCSGFVTYVFNHFGIAVPRQSVSFTDVPRSIDLKDARPGDLILFTGTDSTIRVVGHMGIILSHPGEPITFIHSTSGKNLGVTETPFNSYYQGRYVKTIRIFPQNDR